MDTVVDFQLPSHKLCLSTRSTTETGIQKVRILRYRMIRRGRATSNLVQNRCIDVSPGNSQRYSIAHSQIQRPDRLQIAIRSAFKRDVSVGPWEVEINPNANGGLHNAVQSISHDLKNGKVYDFFQVIMVDAYLK